MPAVVVSGFALLIVLSVVYLAVRLREKRGPSEVSHGSDWFVWLSGLAGLALTLGEWQLLRGGGFVPLAVGAGVPLISAGMALRIASRVALGRFYVPGLYLLPDHRLVIEGIYAYIRHPGYLGFLLLALGIAVVFQSIVGFLAFSILFLPSLLFRIRREEAMMRNHFGQEYDAYAGRTSRLIPGFW